MGEVVRASSGTQLTQLRKPWVVKRHLKTLYEHLTVHGFAVVKKVMGSFDDGDISPFLNIAHAEMSRLIDDIRI